MKFPTETKGGVVVTKKKRARPERVAWGTGRVVVRANLSVIQNMLEEGWPMTTIYSRLKDSLAGLRYRQFASHVRRHRKVTAKPSVAAKPILLIEGTGKPARCS
jgi:hypothetical protein